MSLDPSHTASTGILAGMQKPLSRKHFLFAVLSLVLGALFHKHILALFAATWTSKYLTYIPFVPLISWYLLSVIRKEVFSDAGTSLRTGLFFAVIGAAFSALAFWAKDSMHSMSFLALISASVILLWIGIFAYVYGPVALRKAAFPLLFLFFAVPLPPPLMDLFIDFLQKGSTEAADIIFTVTGVPAIRDGFIFYVNNLTVEVAKECSGIRSALSLIITITLASAMFLRSGPARLLFVLCAIPITILKNGLRIATLTILGVYVDEKILASDLHRQGGIPFFLVALLLAWSILLLLRKWERRGEEKKSGGGAERLS